MSSHLLRRWPLARHAEYLTVSELRERGLLDGASSDAASAASLSTTAVAAESISVAIGERNCFVAAARSSTSRVFWQEAASATLHEWAPGDPAPAPECPGAPTPFVASQLWDIPDPTLRALATHQLGYDTGHQLLLSDAPNLTSVPNAATIDGQLVAAHRVASLSGLERATNLETLDLRAGKATVGGLTSLVPLAGLTHLTTLEVGAIR